MLAVSAVVISLITAGLAIQHGAAMERMVKENEHMVQASTWPYVMVYFSTIDSAGREIYTVSAENRGVGPAEIESSFITYKGARIGGARELKSLVAHQAGHDDRARIVIGDLQGVLPTREPVALLQVAAPVSPPWLIEAFQKANSAIDVQVCYCSILGQCWIAQKLTATSHPRQTSRCG